MSEKRAQRAATPLYDLLSKSLRKTPFLLTDGAKHLADKAGVIGGTARIC